MTQVNKSARLPGIHKHISSFRPTCKRQTLPFRLLVGIGTLVRSFQITRAATNQPKVLRGGVEVSTAVYQQQ